MENYWADKGFLSSSGIERVFPNRRTPGDCSFQDGGTPVSGQRCFAPGRALPPIRKRARPIWEQGPGVMLNLKVRKKRPALERTRSSSDLVPLRSHPMAGRFGDTNSIIALTGEWRNGERSWSGDDPDLIPRGHRPAPGKPQTCSRGDLDLFPRGARPVPLRTTFRPSRVPVIG